MFVEQSSSISLVLQRLPACVSGAKRVLAALAFPYRHAGPLMSHAITAKCTGCQKKAVKDIGVSELHHSIMRPLCFLGFLGFLATGFLGLPLPLPLGEGEGDSEG